MRRVKTTCLSTCCWSAVQRQRCVPSSSSPSSMPRERRPKPWVSHLGGVKHLTTSQAFIVSPCSCTILLVCHHLFINSCVWRPCDVPVCRKPASLSFCSGKRLGLQKVHPERLPPRRGQWPPTWWQTDTLLWGTLTTALYVSLLSSFSMFLANIPFLPFLSLRWVWCRTLLTYPDRTPWIWWRCPTAG